jgi:O-antigen/teichoic acid export membrane protein
MVLDSKSRKRIGFISLESINHFLKPAFTSIISLVAIRFSGEEVWGSFVPYIISIEFVLTFLNWGQKPYLIRSFSLETEHFSTSWFIAFWARVPLLISIFLLPVLIPLSNTEIFCVFGWIFFRFFSQSIESVIQFQRKYILSILAEIFSILTALLVLIYFLPININLLFFAVVAGLAVKSIILIPLVPFGVNWRPSRNEVQNYLKSAFPFLLLSLVGLIQAKIDLYLVVLKMPESDTAFYQVLSGFLVIMQTGAFIILAPFQKNIYRLNSASIKSIKRNYFLLGVLLTIAGSIITFLIMRLLYHFSFSLNLIPLIILYITPLFAYIIESQLLLKANLEKKLLFATSLSALTGFIVCFFTIPIWGLYGALIGGIFARLVIALTVIYFAKHIKTNAEEQA